MPAPKDPVKLAEFKRKHSELMKRKMADPKFRAKAFSWKRDPDKFRAIQEKAHLWQKDPEKVRRATEKRKQNPNYLEAVKKNGAAFAKMWAALSPEELSARGRLAHELHPGFFKELAKKIWSNPTLRAERIAKMHTAEMRARTSQRNRENNPMKHPEARLKNSQTKKGKSYGWTDERRKKMRELALNNTRLKSGTKIELVLREGLDMAIIPFEPNKPVLGVCVPDLVIKNAKIAVFADGCFWHGCQLHCTRLNDELSSKRSERDRRINQTLLASGWHPLRYWAHQINSDIEGCIEEIVSCYLQRHVHPLLGEGSLKIGAIER